MEDFPEPETPVTTINLFFGNLRSMFFRLLLLAPLIKISCLLAFIGALIEFLPVFDFAAAFLVGLALAFDLVAVDLGEVLAEAAIETSGVGWLLATTASYVAFCLLEKSLIL